MLAERRRDPFVDGRQPVGQIGDAEDAGEVVDVELAVEHRCGGGRGTDPSTSPWSLVRPI